MSANRRLFSRVSWALFLFMALSGQVHATAPALLTYQGRLKESGLPVTAARGVLINICDSLVGGLCTPSPSGTQSVSVVNGLFRTTFTVPSTISLETGSWYLEVSVGGSAFSPREMLSANPYSIYASSAATLIANPGASSVMISTPVNFAAMDAAGYSVILSSGINTPNGVVRAKAFFGDGSGLTGIPASPDATKVAKAGDNMTGALNIIGANLLMVGPTANIVSGASVTASAFFGNGAGLTNLPAAGGSVAKIGDAMTGPLSMLSGSTITVSGSAFSVGGASFTVAGGSATVAYSLTAGSFVGNGAGLTGITGTDATKVAKTGDAMTGPLSMLSGSTITVSGSAFSVGGASFTVAGGSATVAYSLTAGSFVGNGAGLTGITGTDATKVAKTGDMMTGNLAINSSTLTVSGPLISTGTSGAVVFNGGGTRFEWIPSSAAIRAGAVSSNFWDAANIGAYSAAFGQDNLANGNWSVVSGGTLNSTGGQYAAVGGGINNTATNTYGVISGGDNNTNNGFAGVIGGGFGHTNTGNFSTIPGGSSNMTSGFYSFAAGFGANANARGAFVWADSAGGTLVPFVNNVADSWLVRSQGGFSVLSSSFNFGNGISTFVYVNNTGLAMATGSSITLSGLNGVIVTQSSITAARFFGDGSQLTGVTAAGAVLKTGDAMSGNLSINSSTLTVSGPIISTGSNGGAVFSGAGTRFMWVPSSAAFRAGGVIGTEWDPSNIGAYSVAMGYKSTAGADFSAVSGGGQNTASAQWAAVSGGFNNSAVGTFNSVGGGQGNSAGPGGWDFVGGGLANVISGSYSVIPGGRNNTVGGSASYSFAAGYSAAANASGAFVWADSQGVPLNNYIQDQFLVRAQGGFDVISSSFVFSNATSTMMYIAGGRVGIGTTAPAAALDVQSAAGDPAVAVFRNAGGVAVATVTAFGVFAGTQTWSYTLYDPQGIQTGDNITSIVSNRLPPATIIEVWCESDDATATINLYNHTSALNILPAPVTCGTSGSAYTGFVALANEIASGGKIDHLTQSVTLGAAHKINVVIKYIQR